MLDILLKKIYKFLNKIEYLSFVKIYLNIINGTRQQSKPIFEKSI
jgi:hypothetical protein